MNKVALITGASRGIGFEIAKKITIEKNDYNCITLLARESDDFKKAIKFLKEKNKYNKKIIYRYVDIGDHQKLKETIDSIYDESGNIHLVVNNAGYTNPVPLQLIKIDDFERTISVNLLAPFTIIQRLLHLGSNLETIINISSTAGINGRAGWLTYSASKAALINMSTVMREELSLYGIRVVCISPGRTATSLRKILAPEEDPKTIMQPEHVAEVVGMLISNTGKYIDSENLVIRI